jgi:hypothetical protein
MDGWMAGWMDADGQCLSSPDCHISPFISISQPKVPLRSGTSEACGALGLENLPIQYQPIFPLFSSQGKALGFSDMSREVVSKQKFEE